MVVYCQAWISPTTQFLLMLPWLVQPLLNQIVLYLLTIKALLPLSNREMQATYLHRDPNHPLGTRLINKASTKVFRDNLRRQARLEGRMSSLTNKTSFRLRQRNRHRWGQLILKTSKRQSRSTTSLQTCLSSLSNRKVYWVQFRSRVSKAICSNNQFALNHQNHRKLN